MKKIIISLIVMIMLSVCVFGAAPGNPVPGEQVPQTETSCVDEIDNDQDGDTDCADSDCTMNQGCLIDDFNEQNQIEQKKQG